VGQQQLCKHTHTSTTTRSAPLSFSKVTWPTPSDISFAYFVNRGTANGPNNLNITNGGGALSLIGQAGNEVASASLTSATVTTLAQQALGSAGVAVPAGFVAPIGAPLPSPSDTWQQTEGRWLGVRYVNLTEIADVVNFREIFIFDTTGTNVAYRKASSSSAQWTFDPTLYTAAMVGRIRRMVRACCPSTLVVNSIPGMFHLAGQRWHH